MMLRAGIAGAVICFSFNPAFAAAPAALLGKTIQVSFSVFTPNMGANGKSISSPRTYAITLYVSSAGRIFDKTSVRNGRFGKDLEIGPENTRSSFRFAGSQLIGTAYAGNFGRQMTIKFDGSFQSCTVDIVVLGSNGPGRVWQGLNGVMYTATGPTSFSDQSCSVQSGNPFAN